MIQLVDSHCHLDGPEFDTDRDEVIARARAAGVRHLVLIGTGATYQEIGAALRIAENLDGAYAAGGIYPHDASKFLGASLDEFREFARHPKFLAVGEIGLDYHYDHSPREAQQRILVAQLDLARELKRPIIIHCREGWRDLRRIIHERWRSSGLGGILHCFSGSKDDASDLMSCGFMVSFAGNLTFKKTEDLREIAREIPIDYLLTETDSPYLAPIPHRGKRNEPAFVREVLLQLAALRKMNEEEMGTQVLGNFKRFFSL